MNRSRLTLVVSEQETAEPREDTTDVPIMLPSGNARSPRLRLVGSNEDSSRTTRHDCALGQPAGQARADGRWLCNPVDPGSSPGAGSMVV